MYTDPKRPFVTSTKPFVERRWWDNPVLHPIWSYTSWVTLILSLYGYKRPQAWFKANWTRPDASKS